MNLSEQLRASHVKRWHIVQTARNQTVAEHSFNVAVIAGSLAAAMHWPGLLQNSHKLELLQWALSHDMIEAVTGDIPTPFKKRLNEAAGMDVVSGAEDLVDSEQMAQYRKIKGTVVESIVKIADLIEAIYFLSDNGIGAHASSVVGLLSHQLLVMVDEKEKEHSTLYVRQAVRGTCHSLGLERVQV
jgi:5'-deoxynucleotidase